MAGVRSSYLPEAADSRLVPLDIVDSPHGRSHRLRLRLHVAARILFNQPIFICEGWALDSTSFQIVASEVFDAIDKLSDEPNPVADFDAYAPFRIGLTAPGNYLSRFSDYLARDDCYWSGNPIFRHDPDARRKVYEGLRRLEGNHAGDAERIGDLFQLYLDNGRVSRAIGKLSRYTIKAPRLRLSQGTIGSTSYFQSAMPLFEDVERCMDVLGHRIWQQEILSVIEMMCKDAARMTSSSAVMASARTILSPDLYPAVEHVSRIAYMDVHSRHEGASFSAPALDGQSPELLRAVDGHVALRRTGLPMALEFNAERDEAAAMFEQLDLADDWRSMWERIIKLAHHREWTDALREIRSKATGQSLDDLLRHGDLGKLEKMLAVHCDGLVLKRSVGERWGLGFKIRGRRLLPKGTDRALDMVIQTALITLPLWFFVAPAAAGAAAVARAVGDRLVDKFIPDIARPLSRQTVASSLFRLFRA